MRYKEEIRSNTDQIIDLMKKSSDWKAMNKSSTHLIHKKSGIQLYSDVYVGTFSNKVTLYVGYPRKDTTSSLDISSWRSIREFNKLKKRLRIRKNTSDYIRKLKSLRNVCDIIDHYEYHEIKISYQTSEYVETIRKEIKEIDSEAIIYVFSDISYHDTFGIWSKNKELALMIAMKFS